MSDVVIDKQSIKFITCPEGSTDPHSRAIQTWHSFSKREDRVAYVLVPSLGRIAGSSSLKAILVATGKLAPDTDIVYVTTQDWIEDSRGKRINTAKAIEDSEKGYILYDETGTYDALIEPGCIEPVGKKDDGLFTWTGSLDGLSEIGRMAIQEAAITEGVVAIWNAITAKSANNFKAFVLNETVDDDIDLDEAVSTAHMRMKKWFDVLCNGRVGFPISAEMIRLATVTIAAKTYTTLDADDVNKFAGYVYSLAKEIITPLTMEGVLTEWREETRKADSVCRMQMAILKSRIRSLRLPMTISCPPSLGDPYIPDMDADAMCDIIDRLGVYDLLDAHLDNHVPIDDLVTGTGTSVYFEDSYSDKSAFPFNKDR